VSSSDSSEKGKATEDGASSPSDVEGSASSFFSLTGKGKGFKRGWGGRKGKAKLTLTRVSEYLYHHMKCIPSKWRKAPLLKGEE